MQANPATPADTRFRRLREKGSRDFGLACRIIDAARMGHVGFTLARQPYVMPMALARDDSRLLLHGSVASRLMKNLKAGTLCCVTVTHLDGMVLARSAFNSSMHYRSVMVFGSARAITEPAEKRRCLDVLTEHLLPGRLADLRPPTRKELNATLLLSLPLETFTAKVSDGPPDDPRQDLEAGIWAGVIPFHTVPGEPQPAPDLDPAIPLPDYLREAGFR
jgi:nitroimidazol reductase NimA-like FMN-containing flavoprotein (pyridoxamine 5'-phosphate oxidase superfamily)